MPAMPNGGPAVPAVSAPAPRHKDRKKKKKRR